jgi:hypothetical protein
MFVMSIFHTEPLSFLRAIINFCKIFPRSWQIKALTFFHLPLGAAKGHWVLEHGRLIWRALTHHSFWQTGTIYLPCFLHRQKELGHLNIRKIFIDNYFEEEKDTNSELLNRELPREKPKDLSEGLLGEQNRCFWLSCWLLVCYEKRPPPVHFRFPPREHLLNLASFLLYGMKFARL